MGDRARGVGCRRHGILTTKTRDLLAGVVRLLTQLTLAPRLRSSRCDKSRAIGTPSLPPQLDTGPFEVVSLTHRARPQQEQDLDQVREYVGCLIASCSAVWTEVNSPKKYLLDSCEMFFGTPEFSARTLSLERSYDHSVVTNLPTIMVGSNAVAAAPKGKEPSNRDLMNTLRSIQRQLKTSGDS